MKKFFDEFKKFITRGNVIDMAVGVIVGSSFTAIVNGLSNFILKPIINWLLALILGKDALSSVYTFLKKVVAEDGTVDLANSIYIDWGSFINAVINFFIVAFVLFSIVKILNRIREQGKKLEEEARKSKPTKEDRKEMKKLGIDSRNAEAVAEYFAQKERAAAEEKALAEEKARLEKEANPSAEQLLKEIRDLLKQK